MGARLGASGGRERGRRRCGRGAIGGEPHAWAQLPRARGRLAGLHEDARAHAAAPARHVHAHARACRAGCAPRRGGWPPPERRAARARARARAARRPAGRTLDSRGMIACSVSPGFATSMDSPCVALPCMMASTQPRGHVCTGDSSSPKSMLRGERRARGCVRGRVRGRGAAGPARGRWRGGRETAAGRQLWRLLCTSRRAPLTVGWPGAAIHPA